MSESTRWTSIFDVRNKLDSQGVPVTQDHVQQVLDIMAAHGQVHTAPQIFKHIK